MNVITNATIGPSPYLYKLNFMLSFILYLDLTKW